MTLKVDMEIIFNGRDDQTNFTTKLIKLICKADQNNKELLRSGFPNAVRTVEHYQKTGEILDLDYDR